MALKILIADKISAYRYYIIRYNLRVGIIN